MTVRVTPKGAPIAPHRVEIIDGRRVKVADKAQVEAASKRFIAKHARAMEILKDR